MNSTAAANTSSENTTGSSRIVSSKAAGYALCTALILSSAFIAVGNLLTIVLFAVNRRLRKRSLFLVINMACADLMLGTVSLPVYIFDVGVDYRFWTDGSSMFLSIFHTIVNTFFSQASLISAAFISGDRFYAIYWPFKHRTLSMRAYRIIIFMVWTVTLLFVAINAPLTLFISVKQSIYPWTLYALILIFIICGCNIGIWRKFEHGGVATQQQNRASQNKRLTKTLLFVSILALLSWLPLIIFNWLIFVYDSQIPWKFYYLVIVINCSNSFVNPVVYALRIPEFREALVLCCLRRQAAPNIVDVKKRNKEISALTPAAQQRILRRDASHQQLAFEQEMMDTKL